MQDKEEKNAVEEIANAYTFNDLGVAVWFVDSDDYYRQQCEVIKGTFSGLYGNPKYEKSYVACRDGISNIPPEAVVTRPIRTTTTAPLTLTSTPTPTMTIPRDTFSVLPDTQATDQWGTPSPETTTDPWGTPPPTTTAATTTTTTGTLPITTTTTAR